MATNSSPQPREDKVLHIVLIMPGLNNQKNSKSDVFNLKYHFVEFDGALAITVSSFIHLLLTLMHFYSHPIESIAYVVDIDGFLLGSIPPLSFYHDSTFVQAPTSHSITNVFKMKLMDPILKNWFRK